MFGKLRRSEYLNSQKYNRDNILIDKLDSFKIRTNEFRLISQNNLNKSDELVFIRELNQLKFIYYNLAHIQSLKDNLEYF